MKFDDYYGSARPYIACFVILRRGNEIAMVLRKNTTWMNGYYGLPAGKVEWGENYLKAVKREAKEEAGVEIKISDLSFVHVAHRHVPNGNKFMDWIDVYFKADAWTGEPHNAEPAKSERLDWFDLSKLPKNTVPSQRAALEQIGKGKQYSEFGWKN